MKVERILAPNPGPFTGPGTNTYVLVSKNEALVIDPGPIDHSHQEAIRASLVGLRPVAVLVTHTHEDHAPLANPLAADLGVPATGYAGGPGFKPDLELADDQLVEFGSEEVQAVHTPGHSPDHLCFRLRDSLFTGDHIMGGSSVVVEEMGPYLDSLRRVRAMQLERLYPGHGEPMDDPDGIVNGYIEHRLEREKQVLAAVRSGEHTVTDIVQAVYADVDRGLHPLAAVSVRAHLEKLVAEGLVRAGADGLFQPGGSP